MFVGMVRNRRIALRTPVAKVTESLTGARTDDQTWNSGINLAGRKFAIGAGNRDVPAGRTVIDAEGFGKLEQAIHDMTFGTSSQVPVTEEVLAITCASTVKSEA